MANFPSSKTHCCYSLSLSSPLVTPSPEIRKPLALRFLLAIVKFIPLTVILTPNPSIYQVSKTKPHYVLRQASEHLVSVAPSISVFWVEPFEVGSVALNEL